MKNEVGGFDFCACFVLWDLVSGSVGVGGT
jgi:hypothetical protein